MATTNVDTLNSLLRGEISAVETYDQALARLTDDAIVARRLQECRRSHEQRVALLRQQVAQAGGEPAHGSGAWGSFAKLVEGGAKLLGKSAAIAALEEGEDHGLRQYRHDLPKLDAATRSQLETQLLREQEQTHQTLSELKHTLRS